MAAEHEIVGLNALLFSTIVVVCAGLAYALKKYQIVWIPESGAAMVFGMLCGTAILLLSKQESETVLFQPEVFFFVILPPIIFEAGFTLQRKNFFSNMSTILFFAVLGTFVSTLIIGYGLYGLAVAGVVPLDRTNPLECLMFGALISAVDPVATLSILGSEKVNADPLLYSLVFGESVLNDAVSIVLFNTFKHFGQEKFTDARVFEVIGQFIGISVGSIILGTVVALAASFMFKHTQLVEHPPIEFTLLFFFAYISYCLAEIIYLSGIMSLFFCGIVMAHYAWFNLSKESKVSTKEAFKSFAMICEQFLFAYLGITAIISARPVFKLSWNVPLIIFTLVACLLCFIARVFNIFPFSFLANMRRHRKISFKMQIVMWFAGLRGAIAFALSLNMTTQGRPVIVTTTMVVVIFTTLVCGGFTETVLRKLGLQSDDLLGDAHAAAQQRESFLPLSSGDDENTVRPGQVRLNGKVYTRGGLHHKWRLFDDNYMKPWFGGVSRSLTNLHQTQELTALEDDDGDNDLLNELHQDA